MYPADPPAPEARGAGAAKARGCLPLTELRGHTVGEKQRCNRVQAGKEMALPSVGCGPMVVIPCICRARVLLGEKKH